MTGYLKNVKSKLLQEVIIIPETLKSPYYPSLNGLRGVAILLVLLQHIGFNNLHRTPYFYIDSALGVHIFFVLSGFLITTLLLKEKVTYGKISLKRFYIRRALRILPIAYLFLLVLIILNITYKLGIAPLDFVASFLFFKNLPIKNEPYTAHFWTLAIEEQFYLTFPFLLASNINKYFILALFIVVLVPAISILGFYYPEFFMHNAIIGLITKFCMYAFWKGPVIILIGSVFSIITFKGMIKMELAGRSYFLSFILLVAAIILHTRTSIFYNKYIFEYLSAIIIAYVILLSINTNNFLSAILNNSSLAKVGIWSYSLYIWQELFIGSHPWEPWTRIMTGYPLYIVIIFKLVIIFIMAYASYTFFELKFLKLKRKFKD